MSIRADRGGLVGQESPSGVVRRDSTGVSVRRGDDQRGVPRGRRTGPDSVPVGTRVDSDNRALPWVQAEASMRGKTTVSGLSQTRLRESRPARPDDQIVRPWRLLRTNRGIIRRPPFRERKMHPFRAGRARAALIASLIPASRRGSRAAEGVERAGGSDNRQSVTLPPRLMLPCHQLVSACTYARRPPAGSWLMLFTLALSPSWGCGRNVRLSLSNSQHLLAVATLIEEVPGTAARS